MAINSIMHFTNGTARMLLSDGSSLDLDESDVDLLTGAFPGACDYCGFDPNEDDEDER